jgi:hypothetical protein
MGKKEKSAMLQRAEQEYDKWEKKEEFRNWMAKKLPTLARGEIDAIGATMILGKSLREEKSLKKDFIHSYMGKGTDQLMASEKKK